MTGKSLTIRPLKPLFGIVKEVHIAAIADVDGSVRLAQTAVGHTNTMFISPADARKVSVLLDEVADMADPGGAKKPL